MFSLDTARSETTVQSWGQNQSHGLLWPCSLRMPLYQFSLSISWPIMTFLIKSEPHTSYRFQSHDPSWPFSLRMSPILVVIFNLMTHHFLSHKEWAPYQLSFSISLPIMTFLINSGPRSIRNLTWFLLLWPAVTFLTVGRGKWQGHLGKEHGKKTCLQYWTVGRTFDGSLCVVILILQVIGHDLPKGAK